MPRKPKNKKFKANQGNWDRGEDIGVCIPDEAVYYIVSNYLQNRSATGVPAVIGVSTQTVEEVLQLLVDWSAKSGHINDGVISIGISQE